MLRSRPAGRVPALAAVALLLALPSPALPQGPRSPITLTVRGVSGPVLKARPGRFLAVNVTIENSGAADATGRVRVYRSKAPGDPAPEQVLFYERQVELPPGSRRQETVYYHCQEREPPNQLAVAYVPEDADIVAPATSFPQLLVEQCELSSGDVREDGEVEPSKMRVLSLTSRGGDDAAGILRAAVIPGPRLPVGVVVERADLTGLPDHAAGYESCEAVLVSDLEPDALPPARATPLLEWVAAGGQLVVAWAGRPEQLERSALAAALPVARRPGQSASQRGLRALRGLAAGRGAPPDDRVLVDLVDPLPGSEVLVADGQGPLVVRGRHGSGWITYAAFPLDAAPLRRWEGRPHLGAALLRLPREEIARTSDLTDAPPQEELLRSLSEAIETLNPPSVLLVAPLLLLYVALVAPVNYKLLARRRRLVWAQAVAAGIALVFGLLFYGLGRVYKGSESLLTHVGLIELAAAPGGSRVETLTGYFSTEQGLSDGRGPPGAVVGPIAEQSTSREGRVVFDPAGTRLEALTLDTWALRRFRALATRDLGHLQADLRFGEGRFAGTLENRTHMRLITPLLLTDTGVIILDDIAPGAVVTLAPSSPRGYEEIDAGLIPLFKGLVQDGQMRYTPRYGLSQGLGGYGDPYKGRTEPRLLGIFRGRQARSPRQANRWPVLLVARSADVGGVGLEGAARVVLDRGVVVCELEAVIAEGRVRIQGLSPRVAQARGEWRPVVEASGSPPQLGGNALQPALVEWVWTLPSSLDAPLVLEGLRVNWSTDPGVNFPKLSELQAWSWAAQDWIELTDLQQAETDAKGRSYWAPRRGWGNPADLVDPASGTVRMRMVNRGIDLNILHVSLDVVGRR